MEGEGKGGRDGKNVCEKERMGENMIGKEKESSENIVLGEEVGREGQRDSSL